MTPELFETSQVPDDPDRWDALAARVAATAVRDSRWSGFDWLASSRASWVAASLLLAAVVAFVMMPAEGSSASSFSGEWARALAPSDDAGKAIIIRDRPPVIGALLLGSPSGGEK